jgi:putative transposase
LLYPAELRAQDEQRHIPSFATNESLRLSFSSLKYELVYHHRFVTRAQARTAIFDYIETFYNRTRLHSSLDYQSPINFESKLN